MSPPCVKVVSLCVKVGRRLCGSLVFVSLHGKLRRVSVVLTPPPPDSCASREKSPPYFGGKKGERERARERERRKEGGEKINLDLVPSHNSSP